MVTFTITLSKNWLLLALLVMKPDDIIFYSVKKMFLLLRKLMALQSHKPRGWICRAAAPILKRNLKTKIFVDTVISKVSHDLRIGLIEPLKSADQ